MQNDILFQKHKTKSFSQKKAPFKHFSFVFLSLILAILCFFIYLLSQSSFEKVKVDAVRTSLQSSFNSSLPLFQSLKPSFEASQVALYHQSLIAKTFPASQISQDLVNDEISLYLPIDNIFEKTSANFTPISSIFFQQLKSLLNAPFVKNKYVVDFIVFEDLTKTQSYPIFSNLTTSRAQQIHDKLQRIGVSDTLYSVGIEKGNAQLFKLHFRKRRF